MTSAELLDLTALDRAGFIPAPNESAEDFFCRVENIRRVHSEFEEKLAAEHSVNVFGVADVDQQNRIAGELVEEAAVKTMELYGFAVRHVPGFFLTRAVGMFWGGCMLSDPDEYFSIFLLRNAFKKHRRFLNYTRDELLAHELCHSARQSLMETTLEEYFAYQTSSSPLRRYLGNCFIHDYDAILFLLPMLLLPIMQFVKFTFVPGLWQWPFWVLALIYPLFLLWRNAASRKAVKAAAKKLKKFGVGQAEAVLFRLTRNEIEAVGRMNSREELLEMVEKYRENEPRWAVIACRFIDPQECGENENNNSGKNIL